MIRDRNVLPQLPVDCSDSVGPTLNEIDVSLPMGVSIAGLRVRQNLRDRNVRKFVPAVVITPLMPAFRR